MTSGAFVTCWGNTNFRDDQLLVTQSTADLSKVTVPGTTVKAGDWIRSLSTGPSCWAIAATGVNGTGTLLYLDPNSCIADLADENLLKGTMDRAISSITLSSKRPANWPGATAPATPSLWRGSVLSDLGAASINKKVKSLCVGLVKSVPGAGPFLGLLVSGIWPSGKPSDTEIWAGMEKWVESLVNDIGVQAADNAYKAEMEGLFSDLSQIQYDIDNKAPELAEHYGNLLHSITASYLPKMDNTSDLLAAQTLTYITVLGTVMIAVLRGSFVYAQEIFGNTDEVAFNRKQTQAAIATVRKTLSRGIAFARQNRMGKITIESGKNWDHTQTWYQLSDPYAQTYLGYKVSTDFTGTSAADAHGTVAKDQSVYTDQFAGPTFDALFQPFLDIANVWTYFDQDPPADKDWSPPTAPQVVKMGPWGGNDMSLTGVFSPGEVNHMSGQFDWPPSSRIVKLELFDLTSIRLTTADGAVRHIGPTNGKVVQTFDLSSPDRAIIGAFGAWDTALKSLQFRTNYSTGSGGLDCFDRGNHRGNNDNGDGPYPFASNGSDGGDAILSGLFGYTDENPSDSFALRAIGFYWTYQTTVARPGFGDA